MGIADYHPPESCWQAHLECLAHHEIGAGSDFLYPLQRCISYPAAEVRPQFAWVLGGGGLIKHYRVPSYSTATLSKWYDSSVPNHMVTLLRYMITRVSATLQILEESEVVTKTAYDSHPV